MRYRFEPRAVTGWCPRRWNRIGFIELINDPHTWGSREGRRASPWRRDQHDDRPEVGDEQNGSYTRERLLAMDARIVERMERAISDGREHRPDREPAQTRTR